MSNGEMMPSSTLSSCCESISFYFDVGPKVQARIRVVLPTTTTTIAKPDRMLNEINVKTTGACYAYGISNEINLFFTVHVVVE
jgi:hypothetical protein